MEKEIEDEIERIDGRINLLELKLNKVIEKQKEKIYPPKPDLPYETK